MLPESTYRVQLHLGFTFRDAAAIVPYLHALGVTHLYASPYLKARPGSTHGYDVIDHCSLNPELGTQADYDALCDALASYGMGHILDTVPNHVGVATNDNVWWNDVLEHGRESNYAKYFDITWDPHNKLVLPVLGAPLDEIISKGDLKVVHEDGKSFVRYYDRRFPLNQESLNDIDRLDVLLATQHYRLAFWREASRAINYRRFFDINDLAALAQEHEEVFETTHALTFKLIEQGKVAGLRIDHPDGLYDPEQYFRRLQARSPGLYVVAEKILGAEECLRSDWPVHGTSGYDFLNMVNGLFVDANNADAFTRIYQDRTGNRASFEDLVYEKKRLILETSLAGELQMLARRFGDENLREALREVIACFPVYRSYITKRGVTDTDVAHVRHAVEHAIARNPQADPAVFRFIGDTVLRDPDFAGKFQQLTAPVMAKGVEDTAFYIYNRFVSLNEVGGEPSRFGVSPAELHAFFAERQAKWPYSMSCLSTHDTKRSEDVRARLNVLSEIPDEWAAHVKRWRELTARHRSETNAPDGNEEYLIYQTLIGAWPLEPWSAEEYDAFVKRVQAYMTKAMREAKVNTTWTDPKETHETAVQNFIAAILDETRGGEFLADLWPFRQRVSRLGLLNSLAQTVLRLTAPGVPDTYQGTELWDFSLVDPDNRRPVDYEMRKKMLAELDQASPGELTASMEDGRVKMFVTSRALQCRRSYPGLFSTGQYVPLEARGERARHVFAFARRHQERLATVVVPRLVAGLEKWGDTQLTLPQRMRDEFTGRWFDGVDVPLQDLCAELPVALLMDD